MITNDAVILGLLALILGAVFYTHSSSHPFWKKFYGIVPAILLCYFLPALLTSFNIIDDENSKIYFVASRYLLPAALVLLCLNIDLKGILGLGPKAIVLFLTGTVGVIIGGPIAFLIVGWLMPEAMNELGKDDIWRGMTTVAGSWIGGTANQTAMKEIFSVNDRIFSAMVAVDVLVANVWTAVLLILAGKSGELDRWRGADTRALDSLREQVSAQEKKIARVSTLPDLMMILAMAFVSVGLAHFLADILAPWFTTHYPGSAKYSLTSHFFWLVVFATAFGLGLSFTKARSYEGAGASKIGSVFIYMLVAAIGTHMHLGAVKETPVVFVIGGFWMLIHASLMLLVCKLTKAPLFYMAVGSQANIGGAASAPVVASAFHPSLASVGVLLAVFGYAIGSIGAYLCGQILRLLAT